MFKKVKSIFIDYCKKYHILLVSVRKLKFIIGRLIYLKYYLFNRIDNNMIIFESYMGRQYSCNPKAIYLELLNSNSFKKIKFIWAFKNKDEFKYLEKNKNTYLVKYGSKEYYKYYSKARIFVTNSRIPEVILKKKKQVYIQTWHGTPLKKLGYDIDVVGGNVMNSIKDIREKYRNDSKRYTYMISPSKFCTEKFSSAFNIKNKSIIKEVGYPRNDYLYNYKKDDVKKIKETLKLPSKKKVILYAPTWRDNEHASGVGYTYKTHIDFDYLKETLEQDYIILFRTHYFIENSFDFSKYKGFVYDVSNYSDINELYVISDLLITDYSSVFFDYANLKRPMLFYMYDYDNYKNKLRDFYIDLEELPGPIVKNEKDLVREINNIKEYKNKYKSKYEKFNRKYNYLEDGESSKRFIKECI